MNALYTRIYLLAILLFVGGCKEVYYPEIDRISNVISVEGLITDQPGPYRIRLSRSSYFYDVDLSQRITGARVAVYDDKGGYFLFSEVSPGIYQSPAQMTGMVGNTYTLEFETEDGELYRSYPQKMLPPYEITSATAANVMRTQATQSVTGGLVIREVPGIEAKLQVNNDPDNLANVRFLSDVKVLYVREEEFDRYYCWKEVFRFEGSQNINLPLGSNNQPGDVSNNVVAFLPDNPDAYFMAPGELISHLLLGVTLYSINRDAYNFYLEVSKQLNSDGTMFAPIPSQISGNIYSVSEPGKPVTGLFEAASVSKAGFILYGPPVTPGPALINTDLYEQIPEPGCMMNEYPPFWVN